MIQVDNLVKVYPMGSSEVRALDGVSLHIGAGEFVAIVGSSGSGKSTIMHLLGCLDRPSAGSYNLLDKEVSGMSDRQLARIRNRHIGFVFQTFNLISRMSAWENVAVPLFYAREAITKPKAMAALKKVGLHDRATHAPNELSGGERQRVAIARSIVNNPSLILADEPTGNLDTQTGQQIMQIFHQLHAAGATIIVVTHEPEIAEQAQRIIQMRDGKIVEDRRSEQRRPPIGDGQAKVNREHLAANSAAPPEVAAGAEVQKAPPTATLAESTGDGSAAVVHPDAKKAFIWSMIGPAAFIALLASAGLLKMINQSNPSFAAMIAWPLRIGLPIMMFVAPVLAFVKGRRGARWAKLAPEKFGGRGRALAAQWIGVSQLVAFLLLIAILIFASILNAKGMLPQRG